MTRAVLLGLALGLGIVLGAGAVLVTSDPPQRCRPCPQPSFHHGPRVPRLPVSAP